MNAEREKQAHDAPILYTVLSDPSSVKERGRAGDAFTLPHARSHADKRVREVCATLSSFGLDAASMTDPVLVAGPALACRFSEDGRTRVDAYRIFPEVDSWLANAKKASQLYVVEPDPKSFTDLQRHAASLPATDSSRLTLVYERASHLRWGAQGIPDSSIAVYYSHDVFKSELMLEDMSAALGEAARVLKPGGFFIVGKEDKVFHPGFDETLRDHGLDKAAEAGMTYYRRL